MRQFIPQYLTNVLHSILSVSNTGTVVLCLCVLCCDYLECLFSGVKFGEQQESTPSGNMSATFRDIAVSINGYQRDVAVFGVSGNPPTGDTGHEGIVKYLVRSRKFDEVWVLPVFRHQFSSKRDLAPFAKRVHLCQIAFESYSSETCKVRVLTVEEDVEASVRKHGTIDTIHFLKKYCPDAHFHLILGSDTYSDIIMGKWKHGER